jgi:deoxyribodipyrimidine photolyase-related protein
LPQFSDNPHLADVKALVEMRFAEHAGFTDNFALPTTRREALKWLREFLEQRFTCFGDYEDALTTRSDHVFHSVLSPLMNIGLLTPAEVLRDALDFAERENIAINNVEGFVRQIAGWREFMFGIYCTDGDTMMRGNFWGHRRTLRTDWYRGTTGLLPLDTVIAKANRIGWAHHIERLMIAGNLMLLAEVHPREVYRWFMELFVDAADWVMVPNVYGMALFADGGTITTKPYVCGANYLRKMGDYPAGDWGTTLDGLFWRFIAVHRRFFERQPRLGMLCGHLDRQSPERRRELTTAAQRFLRSKTRLLPEVA